MSWEQEIYNWLLNPKNSNQNKVSKNEYIRKRFAGEPTSKIAVGISNPALKAKVNTFYKENKALEKDELIRGLDFLWLESNLHEGRMIACYLLNKFKKYVDKDIFAHINKYWIDDIDHWTAADHLCIDVFGSLDLKKNGINTQIDQWVESRNFWKRRLSVTIFLKHVRKDPNIVELVVQNIDKLKSDKNYYVRKSFPWILRESSKSNPNLISVYLQDNFEFFNITELKEASKYLNPEIKESIINNYTTSKT